MPARACAERAALDVEIVEVRLAQEKVAVIVAAARIAAAVGRRVAVQVVGDDRQRGRTAGGPGQAAHQEFLVVLRIVVFAFGILQLAGEAVGQRRIGVERIAEVVAARWPERIHSDELREPAPTLGVAGRAGPVPVSRRAAR